MDILVLGGTRFFGIPMVEELLRLGHEVTIATRQKNRDPFGDAVQRIQVERTDPVDMINAFRGKRYDVVYDKIAYCSNDIKHAMDAIDCAKYIYMSSTAVYDPKKPDTREEDFDPLNKELIWCDRRDFPYDEVKRQAECALWQKYGDRDWIAVRYPFVIGEDDYTKRLLFYVEHTMKSIPMNIDNVDSRMSYIRSDEAGKFMAFLADRDFRGAVNGSAHGSLSLREIIGYVERKTGGKACLDPAGEAAPYNGEPEYSIRVDKAEELGFRFSDINDWIYGLINFYIDRKEDGK